MAVGARRLESGSSGWLYPERGIRTKHAVLWSWFPVRTLSLSDIKSRRKVRRRISMKKSITFLSLSIVLVFGALASAQSKGQSSGHAPSVTQGHGQSGAQDHSKATSSQQGAQSSDSK